MRLRPRVPQELRDRVEKAANGRCEYCFLSQGFSYYPHEVDHIVAISHGGKTTFENLALAGFRCNRRKGPNLASTDKEGNRAFLFDPRHQSWENCFRWDYPLIVPISSVGEATVRVLKLNDPKRVNERLMDPFFRR